MSHSLGAEAAGLDGRAEIEAFRLSDMLATREFNVEVKTEDSSGDNCGPAVGEEQSCIQRRERLGWSLGMRLARAREIRVGRDTLVHNGQYCTLATSIFIVHL